MAIRLTKKTFTYTADDEEEALGLIQAAKDGQLNEGYTLSKYKNDYKCKKDKNGEITSEVWQVFIEEKLDD